MTIAALVLVWDTVCVGLGTDAVASAVAVAGILVGVTDAVEVTVGRTVAVAVSMTANAGDSVGVAVALRTISRWATVEYGSGDGGPVSIADTDVT